MYEYATEVQEDLSALELEERLEAVRAEIECWLIDDFVDILPRDRYAHLNAELG